MKKGDNVRVRPESLKRHARHYTKHGIDEHTIGIVTETKRTLAVILRLDTMKEGWRIRMDNWIVIRKKTD